MRLAIASLAAFVAASMVPSIAHAWGNEGHMVIGHIAYALLTPVARKQVDALLKADEDTLTTRDFVSRTTWADRWRDSDRNGAKIRYNATRQWHFVDIQVPDGLASACFKHPPLPEG